MSEGRQGPSARKRAWALARGHVPWSPPLAAWLVVLAGGWGLGWASEAGVRRFSAWARGVWGGLGNLRDPGVALAVLEEGGRAGAWLVGPVVLAGFLGVVLAGWFLGGPWWSPGAWFAPKEGGTDRGAGLRGLSVGLGLAVLGGWLSLLGLGEAQAVLGGATLGVLARGDGELAWLAERGFGVAWGVVWGVAWPCLLLWGGWAAGEALWGWRRWLQGLGMTREEVEREAREDRGHPQVRLARAQAHRAVQEEGLRGRLAGAQAIFYHEAVGAVALAWSQDEGPRVIARSFCAGGAGLLRAGQAQRVALFRDEPLARALCGLPEGAPLPQALYRAVAAQVRA